METIKAVYINEIFKISKKKKITAALLFSVLSVIISVIAVYSLKTFAGVKVTGSSQFPTLILTIFNNFILPLFTIFITIDMFAGEFADNTIKITLTGPASRMNVFLGKILAIATFIMGNLIFVMLLSIIASLFMNRSISNLLTIFISYFMAFLPMFIFALVVVLISNIARGTTSTFMFSVFIFILFNGLSLVFPEMKTLLFTSTFNWYRLILGSYINFGKILRVFLILLGYGTMLMAGSYYLFEKRDI